MGSSWAGMANTEASQDYFLVMGKQVEGGPRPWVASNSGESIVRLLVLLVKKPGKLDEEIAVGAVGWSFEMTNEWSVTCLVLLWTLTLPEIPS